MPGEPSETLSRAWRDLADGLAAQGVLRSERVARAFRTVPRHLFIPDRHRDSAYVDTPLPLPGGQTVSAPHMVVMMLEALDVREGHRVLEVGTGSGYHAALLAELVHATGETWSIERIPALAHLARENLRTAGYAGRVQVVIGDGTLGLPGAAPFDRIHVAAGGPRVPEALVAQLAPEGLLLVPIGSELQQDLTLVRKDAQGRITSESLGPVLFVPLVGEQGWRAPPKNAR